MNKTTIIIPPRSSSATASLSLAEIRLSASVRPVHHSHSAAIMQPVLQPPARLQLSPQEAMLAAIVTDFQCRQTGSYGLGSINSLACGLVIFRLCFAV